MGESPAPERSLARIERVASIEPSDALTDLVHGTLVRGQAVVLVVSCTATARSLPDRLAARGIDLAQARENRRLVLLLWGPHCEEFPGAESAGRDLVRLEAKIDEALARVPGPKRVIGDFLAAAEASHDAEEVEAFLRRLDARMADQGDCVLLETESRLHGDAAVDGLAEDLGVLESQADEALEELEGAVSATEGVLKRRRRVTAALAGISLGGLLGSARAAVLGEGGPGTAVRWVVPVLLALLILGSAGTGPAPEPTGLPDPGASGVPGTPGAVAPLTEETAAEGLGIVPRL